MQLKQLLQDDDAVSPVIGVILMVAITVILAAVIGTFVLGLGDQVQDSAPNADFNFDYDESGGSYEVEVTHEGGNQISTDNAQKLLISDGTNDVDWLSQGSPPVQAGDSCTFDASSGNCNGGAHNLGSGDDIRVIWFSQNGDSQTIADSSVPN